MDGQNWRGLNGLHLSKFEKPGPTFFASISQFISECHLDSWKIILIYYVAVVSQMEDSCTANLMFRTHN